MSVVLAIDLGSAILKAGFIELDGTLVAETRAAYPTQVTRDLVEQDPEEWWRALVGAVARLRAAAPHAEVVAICADAQGPTCVATDAEGRPQRPAITWQDRRAVAETADLSDAVGLPGWLLGILPAALWIERHEPDVAGGVVTYLAAWEWLSLRLSGQAAWSRSADQVLPDPERAAPAGLPAGKLPPVVDAGATVGGLLPGPAATLGLPAGIPVVAGLNDAYASCLGAGLLESGDALDTGGSAGGLVVYADREPTVPGAWIGPAPVRGRWIVGGAMAATGRSLDWLAGSVLGGAVATDVLLEEAAMLPPGADGLVFLPYLAGERSPIWDPEARGAFVGLTLAHGRGHLVRAVLEGSAFALRHVAEPIAAAGIPITELRLAGGSARSDAWNRIKADVLGVPAAVPAIVETAMVGSAILAAVGIGAHDGLRDAVRAMVRIDHRLAPDPSARAVYDDRMDTYRALYPALAPAMHALGRSGSEDRSEQG
jgi:xylulokinase